MTFPVDYVRRACEEARNAPGMRVGLPRVTLDVSHVEALLDRLAGAEQECNRLGREVVADVAAERSACAEFLRGKIRSVRSAGMVVENADVQRRLEQIAYQMARGPVLAAAPAPGPGEDLSCPTCSVVDAAVAFCNSQHADGTHIFSREAYNALVTAVSARGRWAKARTCRRCTTCEDFEHHWVEDPQPDVVTDWTCKHCPARGVECPACDGEPAEAEDCDVCNGAMVVRAEPMVEAAATLSADPTVPPAPDASDEFSPEWVDGLPHCDDRCAQHDGKRCRMLGFPPGRAVFCEPALDAMRDDRDALRAAVRAFLVAHDSGRSVREEMAALREVVG